MFRWSYNRVSWIDATQLKKEINCWRKQVNTLGFSPVFTAQLRQRPLDGEWQQERRPSPCRGRESLCVWFYSFSSVGHVRRPWCAFHNLVFFSSTFRSSCHFFLAPVRKHSNSNTVYICWRLRSRHGKPRGEIIYSCINSFDCWLLLLWRSVVAFGATKENSASNVVGGK